MFRNELIIRTLLVLLFASCSLPTDPGPQPNTIIDTQFEPGYNILGILRSDGNAGDSFLRVERVFKEQELTNEFSPVMKNVSVEITRRENSARYTFHQSQDSIRGIIYTNPDFQSQPGDEYSLTITGDSLPEVNGTTKIPERPAIDSASVEVTSGSVRFVLLPDSSIHLYDVYLFCENAPVSRRIRPVSREASAIRFDLTNATGEPIFMQVYGYEKNLARYLTAPVSIKPQTYRETVTTVSGGYGVFGAVSVSEYLF